MKSIEQTLIKSLNFSEKKAKTYLALLELGESEASEIASKAGLKRTTVYNILPELISEGLIATSLAKGKKHYFIESPSKLSMHLENKKEEVNAILPDLTSMQALFFHKPKITTHEGVEGFKDIYNDFIESASKGDTLLAYAGTRDHFKYAPEGFVKACMKRRIDKNLHLKLIAGSSALSHEFGKEDAKSLRQTKITDSKDFDFAGETIIYGNKVAFISYKENFLGIIVESKEISAMHRATFNLLWDRLD